MKKKIYTRSEYNKQFYRILFIMIIFLLLNLFALGATFLVPQYGYKVIIWGDLPFEVQGGICIIVLIIYLAIVSAGQDLTDNSEIK